MYDRCFHVDRAETILALADTQTTPSDLGRPGHSNPLRARSRGLLRRGSYRRLPWIWPRPVYILPEH